MKAQNHIVCVLGVAGVVLLAAVKLIAQPAAPAGPAGAGDAPSIAGNYVLDHRELPDGKQVRPPEVIGMMTLTKDRRNFNVYWTQDGKPVSVSIISKHTLTPTDYTEECQYYATNGVDGQGPTYDTTPKTGTAKVKVDGDKISFKFPLHDEPEVVFDKTGFTATRKGAFVDHWRKVE